MDSESVIRASMQRFAQFVASIIEHAHARPNLSTLMDDFFFDLATEIHERGISRRIAADMFGLVLRSYLNRLQRHRDHIETWSLSPISWWKVYSFVSERPGLERTELFSSMPSEDERTISSILRDMVMSGLITETRCGKQICYFIAPQDTLEIDEQEQLTQFVWAFVFGFEGPCPRSRLVNVFEKTHDSSEVEKAIRQLQIEGKLEQYDSEGEVFLNASPLESSKLEGWEASINLHIATVLEALSTKIAWRNETRAPHHLIGGSTWFFHLWEGHPFEDEVVETLSRSRQEIGRLFTRVRKFNAKHLSSGDTDYTCTIYVGQGIRNAENRWEV